MRFQNLLMLRYHILWYTVTKPNHPLKVRTFSGVDNGPTDPYEAMDTRLQVNSPSSHDHLFSYTLKGSRRPLTKQALIKRLALALVQQV
jgi:hypothetical protein